MYQEVNITLRVAGRKDNTVTMAIFENGTEIHNVSVTRATGEPQTDTITLKKYLDRSYEIRLYYTTSRQGCNPIEIIFESGDKQDTTHGTFGHIDGYTFYAVHCHYGDIQFSDCDITRGSSISTEVYPIDDLLAHVTEGNRQFFFDASSSYDIDGNVTSYQWTFGDGAQGDGSLVEHTFAAVGDYQIELRVTDDDGAMSLTIAILAVQSRP
ncbi:MAG: PKD domain-containing protein [Euryarchaeota archaeon]|nr:PKD domain-containing protein [Euryarchaeota archaeon]